MKILRKIIPEFVFKIYHFLLAFFSAVIYRFPSDKFYVIGITGTSGKTTVAYLINHILQEAGYKTAMLTSQEIKIGDKIKPNLLKMTMPGRFYIQKFLSKAKKEKCDFVILEVTSEGILQFRHRFINFDVGILTNLSPEHIERHKGFKNYKKAKFSFFKYLSKLLRKKLKNKLVGKAEILNLDCNDCLDFFIKDFDKKVGYGINFKKSDFLKDYNLLVKPKSYKILSDKIQFVLENDKESVLISTPLLGIFNFYNVLTAIAVSFLFKIPILKIKSALENFKGVPGRLEFIDLGQSFKIVVDYAHTPKSLKLVYQILRSRLLNPDSKMICVLGAAGGGRDKWKRPVLGKIADKYCHEIILTNEDPYDEDPQKIINEIKKGIKNKDCLKILDRRKAISQALKLINKNDILVITGKGAEPFIINSKGKKIPWDDRKVVKEEYYKLKSIIN